MVIAKTRYVILIHGTELYTLYPNLVGVSTKVEASVLFDDDVANITTFTSSKIYSSVHSRSMLLEPRSSRIDTQFINLK